MYVKDNVKSCLLEMIFLDMLVWLSYFPTSPPYSHISSAPFSATVDCEEVKFPRDKVRLLSHSSVCCKDPSLNQMNKEENYSLYFRIVKGFSVSDSLAFFCHFLT